MYISIEGAPCTGKKDLISCLTNMYDCHSQIIKNYIFEQSVKWQEKGGQYVYNPMKEMKYDENCGKIVNLLPTQIHITKNICKETTYCHSSDNSIIFLNLTQNSVLPYIKLFSQMEEITNWEKELLLDELYKSKVTYTPIEPDITIYLDMAAEPCYIKYLKKDKSKFLTSKYFSRLMKIYHEESKKKQIKYLRNPEIEKPVFILPIQENDKTENIAIQLKEILKKNNILLKERS